ncbi:MAG: DUF6036 family nucleotidyltransferase [Candidatus Omnitrophota bacterium]|nr:DUF6036 family nucleotidyltransferase [Candidatus Omnitrophota bacterium]
MSGIKLDNVIQLLKKFSRDSRLEIILIGGLSLEYYGLRGKATLDIDAEVKGDVDKLSDFLRKNRIPSDIGEDISRWSLISLPPGYKKRATTVYSDDKLKVKVLSPIDFVIAKLRRGTEADLNDSLFIAGKFSLKAKDIIRAANQAVKNSPRDTAIFIFNKNVEVFTDKLRKPEKIIKAGVRPQGK